MCGKSGGRWIRMGCANNMGSKVLSDVFRIVGCGLERRLFVRAGLRRTLIIGLSN